MVNETIKNGIKITTQESMNRRIDGINTTIKESVTIRNAARSITAGYTKDRGTKSKFPENKTTIKITESETEKEQDGTKLQHRTNATNRKSQDTKNQTAKTIGKARQEKEHASPADKPPKGSNATTTEEN